MSKTKEQKVVETPSRHVNLQGEVLCGCTGTKCGGTCGQEHLRNNRTGTCISAYNPPIFRERNVERDRPEEYQGIFGDY